MSRVNNFARLGPAQRARTVRNVAQASLERAGEWLRRRRGSRPMGATGATGATGGRMASTAEARRRTLLRVYWTAMARYVPQAYAGRVTLLWPRDDADRRAAPQHGWGDVASELDLRYIPGTHATCTTEHVRALAACVQACLQKVDAFDPRPFAQRMRLSVRVGVEEVDSGCVCALSLGPELSPPPLSRMGRVDRTGGCSAAILKTDMSPSSCAVETS